MQIKIKANKKSGFIRIALFMFFAIIFLKGRNVFAAGPVLNFSDITNGPSSGLNDGLGEGAIVTVWGNNLGSSQGNSSITIGGVVPAHIYYWKNADGTLPGGPANLYKYHKMQEIALSIPSSLAAGTYDIVVTVDGVKSNALQFTVRSGNIYHAMTSGSPSGDGSFENPWSSWILGGGLDKMVAGDILYLHDGTKDITTTKHIVSGKTGSIANPFGIIVYPNSRYLLHGDEKGIDFYNSNSFVISKIQCTVGYLPEPSPTDTTILDRVNSGGIEGAPYTRIIANEITDKAGTCVSGTAGAIVASCGGGACDPVSSLKVLGNYIHDWGCNQTSHFEHTTYISIRNGGYVDVEPWEMGWNLLENNKAKYGIHNYDETYTTNNDACGNPTGTVRLHDNYIINQKGAGINVGAKAPDGYTCWNSGSFEIYNNVIIESGKGPADENGYDTNGIRVGDAGMSTPVKIYNNTVYSWGDDSLGAGGGIATYETTNSGRTPITITNNIVYDTRGGTFTLINPARYTQVSGSNNIWFSKGGASTADIDSRLTTNILLDPQFIDIAGDYQLRSTSPAIDQGVTGLSSKDFLSNPRPQGSGWDIGAYEYTDSRTTTTTRADVDQSGTINTTDAMLTLRNSLGINMSNTNWHSSTTTGDVDCNGTSNSTDAMLILRYSLGLSMSGTNWCVQ